MYVWEDGWIQLQNSLFCPDVLAFKSLTRHLWWCTLLDSKQWDIEAGDCKLSTKEGYLAIQCRRKNSNLIWKFTLVLRTISEKIHIFLLLILLAACTVHINLLNVQNYYLPFYFRQSYLEGRNRLWGDGKSNGRNSHFIWKVTWFHYIARADLELAVQTRLVSNSHRFTNWRE